MKEDTMPHYLLIESRDPFESNGFSLRCDLALALLAESAGVTLFLVENAVLGARAAAKGREIKKLSKAGIRVLADAFALRERGINPAQVIAAVQPADLDVLIGQLADGAKALWH